MVCAQTQDDTGQLEQLNSKIERQENKGMGTQESTPRLAQS